VKRWLVATVIFVAGTAAGGLVVWKVSDSGDSGSAARGSKVDASKPRASATGKELLDRLAAGTKSTFHVRYSYSTPNGASFTLEVWHRPDRVRRDIVAVSPTEGTSHTEEFLEDGKLTRCLLLDGHPWQCVAGSTGGSDLTDPLNGADHNVDDKTVTVTDDTIAGHPARCYHAASAVAGGKSTQFCFSSDNVPLRIDGGDGKPVDATNYDTSVPDSVFAHPAPVAGSGVA
jgi:hypothetical protein